MNNRDNAGKTGQVMIYIAWILFLGLLTLGFNQFLERQYNPNQNVTTDFDNTNTEVRLLQNRSGHYVVNGKINQYPVTFLIDTGATLISIPSSVAARVGLKTGFPSSSRTANGTITVYATRLDSVRIGSIQQKNVRAVINPHMQGKEVLLGMSFLKHIEMIQKGQELILRN